MYVRYSKTEETYFFSENQMECLFENVIRTAIAPPMLWRNVAIKAPGQEGPGEPGQSNHRLSGENMTSLETLSKTSSSESTRMPLYIIIIFIFEFYWEINIKCVECPIHLPSPAVRVNSKLCCGMESCFTVQRYILFNVILILYNPCSVIVSTLCCSAMEWQYIAILQCALLSDGIQYCNIRNTKCIHGQRQCIAEKYK